MIQMTALLSDCGFRHVLPPALDHAGMPQAFDPQADYSGNVFTFGPLLRDDPLLELRRLESCGRCYAAGSLRAAMSVLNPTHPQ